MKGKLYFAHLGSCFPAFFIFVHYCGVELCGLVGREFYISLVFSGGIRILVLSFFFSFSPPNIHVIAENILKSPKIILFSDVGEVSLYFHGVKV